MLSKTHLKKGAFALLSTLLVLGSASSAMAANPAKKPPAYAHEIKSLSGEDSSDLEFLKPLLEGKTVVSLGENFHRVAEYSSLKTKMIKYLHEELGFDVIAFESGLGDAEFINRQVEQLTPFEAMQYSVMPVWHSTETLELFNYIKKTRSTDNPLQLAGYDNQYTSPMLSYGISDFVSRVDKTYGEAFLKRDLEAITEFYEVLNEYGMPSDDPTYTKKMKAVIQRYVPMYENYIQYIEEMRKRFEKASPNDSVLIDVVLKSLHDRIRFIEDGLISDVQKSYESRDREMAEHVEWLTKVRYPGKKIILWAHNDHLAKNTSQISVLENDKWGNSFTSMGELLHKKLKDQVYVLGFYMNSGKTVSITTMKEFSVGPMPKGSLEHTVMQMGYKNTFIDLSGQKKEDEANRWMWRPIYAAEDGMTREVILPNSMKFIPREQFDGLVVIDQIHAPTLIEEVAQE
ncbi:erythromycin esterase family protein [Gorillibacterium sp. CAU 1737]|uniref:erythromycin esterase family protein n=1 Tax=Gorillibacterium sp. CAU 1737 TaxID=3140362 RepID=UPI00326083BE